MGKKFSGRTWTFEPADDVREAVSHFLGPNPKRGDKSRLFNEALRGRMASSALRVAEQELAAITERTQQLRALVEQEKLR